MLTTVGREWVVQTAPTSIIKEATDKSKSDNQYIDFLYQVDFIHLGDFLFKKYETQKVAELFEKLESLEDITDMTLEEIRGFVPQSNWDRYFSSIVDCDADFLNKKWKKLYELRCKVAHNTIIGKKDYDDVINLYNETEIYLTRAINNIDKIKVLIDNN